MPRSPQEVYCVFYQTNLALFIPRSGAAQADALLAVKPTVCDQSRAAIIGRVGRRRWSVPITILPPDMGFSDPCNGFRDFFSMPSTPVRTKPSQPWIPFPNNPQYNPCCRFRKGLSDGRGRVKTRAGSSRLSARFPDKTQRNALCMHIPYYMHYILDTDKNNEISL